MWHPVLIADASTGWTSNFCVAPVDVSARLLIFALNSMDNNSSGLEPWLCSVNSMYSVLSQIMRPAQLLRTRCLVGWLLFARRYRKRLRRSWSFSFDHTQEWIYDEQTNHWINRYTRFLPIYLFTYICIYCSFGR